MLQHTGEQKASRKVYVCIPRILVATGCNLVHVEFAVFCGTKTISRSKISTAYGL